jgi:hypothetical protein
MSIKELEQELIECFRSAERDEKNGKKHKGLLVVRSNDEEARYGPFVKMEKVLERYEEMTLVCKQAICQAEEIVFSDKEYKIPEEMFLQEKEEAEL